jgi:hypothetical protein
LAMSWRIRHRWHSNLHEINTSGQRKQEVRLPPRPACLPGLITREGFLYRISLMFIETCNQEYWVIYRMASE